MKKKDEYDVLSSAQVQKIREKSLPPEQWTSGQLEVILRWCKWKDDRALLSKNADSYTLLWNFWIRESSSTYNFYQWCAAVARDKSSDAATNKWQWLQLQYHTYLLWRRYDIIKIFKDHDNEDNCHNDAIWCCDLGMNEGNEASLLFFF